MIKNAILFFWLIFAPQFLFPQKAVSFMISTIWEDAPNHFINFKGNLVENSEDFEKYTGQIMIKYGAVQIVKNKTQNVTSFFVEWNYDENNKAYLHEEVQNCVKQFEKIAVQHQLQVVAFGKEESYSFTAIEKKENLPVFTIVKQEDKMLLLITDVLYRKPIVETTKEVTSNSSLISNITFILNDAAQSFEKIRTVVISPRAYDTTIYDVNQGIFDDEKGHIVRYEANYSFVLKAYFPDDYYYVNYFPVGSDKEQQFKAVLLPHLELLAKKYNWKIKKYTQDKLVKDQVNGVVYYDANKEKVMAYYENTTTKSISLKIFSKINPSRDFTYKGAIVLYQKNIGGKDIANARIYHITDVSEPNYETLKNNLIKKWQNPELIVQFEFRERASQQTVMLPFLNSKLNIVEYDIDAQGNDR